MARKKRSKTTKQRPQPAVKPIVEKPTDELKQHFAVGEETVSERGRKFQRYHVINHPLLYYFSRREIDLSQRNAGLQLAGDYALAHGYRTVFDSLRAELGTAIDGPPDIDNPHVARERWRKALKKLNEVSRRLAMEVCIEGKLVSDVRPTFNWNKKNNGMDRFREMLDELHEFYVEDRKAGDDRADKQREARALDLGV